MNLTKRLATSVLALGMIATTGAVFAAPAPAPPAALRCLPARLGHAPAGVRRVSPQRIPRRHPGRTTATPKTTAPSRPENRDEYRHPQRTTQRLP